MEENGETFPVNEFIHHTVLKIVTSQIFRWCKNRRNFAATTNQKLKSKMKWLRSSRFPKIRRGIFQPEGTRV